MLGRILLLLGGLVVVTLFTALLAPFFVDWSSFRQDFETQASRILGKKVTVHGTVDARILPFPSVSMRDVRVGQDVDGTPLVQVEQFSMDMELAPFLSGEARIFDMRLEKPKARIRVLKDGRLDWVRGSRPEIPTRTIVLEDVHLVGAEIEFIDEATGRTRQLTGLTAEMSASSVAGPWRAEGNATLDGYEAKFSLASGDPDKDAGKVPLRMRIWPDVQPIELQLDGALAVNEGKPEYQGEFGFSFLDQPINPVLPQGVKPPPPPRAKGKFALTNDRIRVPEYRVEVGALDNPYVITGEATLDTGDRPEFLLTADGQQVDVNRLTAELMKGKTARNPHVSAQQRLAAFTEMAARFPIPQVPGKASIRLPAIVADGTTIRDIRLDIRPAKSGWTVENAVAILPGRTQVEAQGSLSLDGGASFIGRMLLASNQPTGLSDWLTGKVDPAIRQLKSAGFSANVNLTPHLQRFDALELAVGSATLKGRVERQSPAEETPTLSMDLSGDEIDLDALRALASLMTGNDAGEDVLDHRLAAHLKADRLMAFGMAAEKVETMFELGDGALSLERLTIGNLAGAQLTARGRAEGSFLDYQGNGSVTFNAFDPGPFLTMLEDRLPAHPLLQRMVRNSSWYADTKLSAEVVIGNGAAATVTGRSNGSDIHVEATLGNLLDFTADTTLDMKAVLKNADASTLVGQAGFQALPFESDRDASLEFQFHREGDQPARTTLAYRTDRTTFSASGDVVLGADGFGNGQVIAKLSSSDLEPTLMTAGVGLPQFGIGLPTELAGKISVDPQRIAITELAGQIGGNGLSGALSIDRQAPLPTAQGSLSLDLVDLAWLGEAVYGPLLDPDTGALAEKDFALPMFAGTDLTLDLKAAVLKAPRIASVTNVSGRLVSRGGSMVLEDASGQWLGGHLAGRLSMSNSEGIGLFQTKLKADNVDLAPLVWQSGEKPVATGRMEFDLVAEATAKSPADLLSAASGSGTLHLKKLALPRVNEALLPALLARADTIEGEVTQAKVKPLAQALVHAGQVTIGSVDIPFTMAGGQVRAQNIAAASGRLGLTGQVRIDLTEQSMEGSLDLVYDAADEALAGGDPALTLDYAGSLANPQEEIDVSQMSNYLSLRAFEKERRRVETLQASVLEKQRLRREVALFTFREKERQDQAERAAAEARARAEEEARLRAEEEERRAREQQQREELPQLTVPPTGDLFRQNGALPGVSGN